MSPTEFKEYLTSLVSTYNLFSLEDPFYEEGWGAWSLLTKEVSTDKLIVADDLVTTSTKRLSKMISEGSANGVVAKLNQVWTLSETFDFISKAQKAGMKIIIAHRGGETEDTFISDLTVGVRA